jgi:hypothetical protein
MSTPEITEAEVVPDDAGREIALAPRAELTVSTPVTAGDLVSRLGTIRDAMSTAMQEDVDYGVIPGTDKPTLMKPGAEKLGVLFQLDVQLINEKTWGPGEHLTVVSQATVFHAPTGARVGYGEGVCTTRERKYAYRKADRACPSCGLPAIIKGKAEYGGGWLCWSKKGGCNAKFPDGDTTIESQTVGDVENPDLPDLWNTVVKMAEKRARVDAILAVTGASALFTQDMEDAAVARAETQPAYGKPAEEAQIESARNAIAYLAGVEPDSNLVGLLLNQIEQAAGGYLPHFPLAQVARVALAVRNRREADPALETNEERAERERAEAIAAESA